MTTKETIAPIVPPRGQSLRLKAPAHAAASDGGDREIWRALGASEARHTAAEEKASKQQSDIDAIWKQLHDMSDDLTTLRAESAEQNEAIRAEVHASQTKIDRVLKYVEGKESQEKKLRNALKRSAAKQDLQAELSAARAQQAIPLLTALIGIVLASSWNRTAGLSTQMYWSAVAAILFCLLSFYLYNIRRVAENKRRAAAPADLEDETEEDTQS